MAGHTESFKSVKSVTSSWQQKTENKFKSTWTVRTHPHTMVILYRTTCALLTVYICSHNLHVTINIPSLGGRGGTFLEHAYSLKKKKHELQLHTKYSQTYMIVFTSSIHLTRHIRSTNITSSSSREKKNRPTPHDIHFFLKGYS